jgi:hypothetical protein
VKKKELFAMIRQLDCPAFFFFVFGSREKWTDLILYQLLNNRPIAMEAAVNLTYNENRDLIRMDPVITARYFDDKMK